MTGRYNTLLPPPRRLWFVCVFVNKISQKVMNGFQWHFQKMLIMGQGTADNILVMVRILGRLWPLTIPRSQLKGLWSWSNPLCYVTLYYHCLQYIYIFTILQVCRNMWGNELLGLRPSRSFLVTFVIGFISFPLDVQIPGAQCRF